MQLYVGDDYIKHQISLTLKQIEMNINKVSLKTKETNLNETDIIFDIKHILDDMQSVLDYLAVNIYEELYGPRKGRKIYFPYTKEQDIEKDIISKTNRYFPNLLERTRTSMTKLQEYKAYMIKATGLLN